MQGRQQYSKAESKPLPQLSPTSKIDRPSLVLGGLETITVVLPLVPEPGGSMGHFSSSGPCMRTKSKGKPDYSHQKPGANQRLE